MIVSRDLNSGPALSHSKTDILIGEHEGFKMLTYLCNPKYYQNAFEHGDDPGEIRPNGSRVSYNHKPLLQHGKFLADRIKESDYLYQVWKDMLHIDGDC